MLRREPQIVEPKPKRQPDREQYLDARRWQTEWGGEHAANRYHATAAADLLVKRLGNQLSRFLALADKTDVNMIFDRLREVEIAKEAASMATSMGGGGEDEPPLPFTH